MWTILPHGGSSPQVLREELLTRFLTVCPDRKITGLLADREFVGKTWFAFLDQHRIPPCIRLPASATVGTGGMPVWACFKKLQPGEVRRWHRPIRVYGVFLRVCATKNVAGEILYLAYRGRAGINLERYSRRWQAENLHSALKSRGLGLEDTGVTQAERISTLLTAVSIAFIWACLTGELLAAKTPPRRKNNRHRAVSGSRLSLDHLQDLLLHPSRASWRVLLITT